MVNLVILLEIAGICSLFISLVLLLSGDSAREQKLMVLFLCGSLVQNMGYLMELVAPDQSFASAAVNIENFGSAFIPICYCWFIYAYCYEKPPRKLLKLIAALDFTILPIIIFNPHGLFYREMDWLSTSYGYHYLSIQYGPLYHSFLVIRIILPFALSIYALCRRILTHPNHAMVRQYTSFLIASTFPVIALLAYTLKLTQVFDLTPVVLGLSLSLVVILVWSRRNYNFRHLAADMVLNNMADGVMVLDEHKRLVSYNAAATGIFDELDSSRKGDSISSLSSFREGMLREDAAQSFAIHNRFYESHAKPIVDGNGKLQGYVMLVIDVTDTRNYIEEIKQVRIQAEKANIAKSEFLANMSHEIRTPMNAVIGLSDIIMEESRGTKVYSHAKDVQSAAKSLLAIINDILDLSKVEAGKMELVFSDYYIKAVVGEVVSMMDMAASQRGLVMKYEFDPNMPCRYYGDAGRIKQILVNLLNNAVKFTKQGYVKISVSGQPGPGGGQELLAFQVEDTGCGIRAEDQEQIFDDFIQVDSKRNRSVEGTGLGLAITKHLVQLMGGSIELESVYGEGSTFTVTIPQKIVDSRTLAEVPETPPDEDEQTEPFLTSGYKVLIVDDNMVNRKVARGFLKAYGFDLTEAASGPEAIKMVKETLFDFIFMDHMMPEMDGIEAVNIIRSQCGENGTRPVIIALTANAMEGVREKFLKLGFQDFIAKPLGRKPLNDLLLRWIPEDRRTTAGWGAGESLDPEGIRIRGIDVDAAMRTHSGSLQDYRELLELFCLEGRRKTGLLRQLCSEGDFQGYAVEVHGLKSAAANIGAMKLSALAKEHESAANRGDMDFITSGFPELISAYGQQTRDIEAYLRGQPEEAEPDALPELDQDVLAGKVRDALCLLEKFRSKDCAAAVRELLAHRMPAGTAASLEEILAQLKIYEDDEAEELLRQLLAQLTTEEAKPNAK